MRRMTMRWLCLGLMVACSGGKSDDGSTTPPPGACDLGCDYTWEEGDDPCSVTVHCAGASFSATCFDGSCTCGMPSLGLDPVGGGLCDLTGEERACEALALCESAWISAGATGLTAGGAGEATPTGCVESGIAVAPGTGETSVVPLAPGGEVVLVHGPQGGWHIDLAGVVTASSELVSIDATYTDVTTGTVVAGLAQQPARIALVDYVDCEGSFYGVRVFVDDVTANVSQSDICALSGATLRLDLAVTALDADLPTVAVASVEVTARLDPNDVPLCP